MHACFEEMEKTWRIVWEDLTYFAVGGEDQEIFEENHKRIYIK